MVTAAETVHLFIALFCLGHLLPVPLRSIRARFGIIVMILKTTSSQKIECSGRSKGAQTWRLMNDFMWVLASATALRHVSNNKRLQRARAIDNGSAIEHNVKATCGSEKPTLCPTRQLFEPKINAASAEALQNA